jgi:carboxymethylenebutenolidase
MSATTDVSFPASTGRPMRAALAAPNDPGPRPAVLVLHEAWGLNDDIRRLTGCVADLGYTAMAPDLFDGNGPWPLCLLRAFSTFLRGRGRVFDDIEAARRWLADRPDVDAQRVGVVGFCLGGGFALLYATRAPLRAAGTFYGAVPRAQETLRGICPTLGSYGGRDRIFGSHADRLERHLSALGVAHDVRRYPDAGHSFMSHHEGLPALIGTLGGLAVGFHRDAEADSWRRIERFFREHLG